MWFFFTKIERYFVLFLWEHNQSHPHNKDLNTFQDFFAHLTQIKAKLSAIYTSDFLLLELLNYWKKAEGENPFYY